MKVLHFICLTRERLMYRLSAGMKYLVKGPIKGLVVAKALVMISLRQEQRRMKKVDRCVKEPKLMLR